MNFDITKFRAPAFFYTSGICAYSAELLNLSGDGLYESEGWHDGRARSSSPLGAYFAPTAFHEWMHDLVYFLTSFGNLQRFMVAIADEPNCRPGIRQSALASSSYLFTHCRWSHEVVATYCGLKMSDASAINQLQVELPDAYRGYYDVLAQVFDREFPCTYLQYQLGKSISDLVFMPDIIAAIDRWDGQHEIELAQPLLPDFRLRKLLTLLAPETIARLRRNVEAYAQKLLSFLRLPPDIDVFNEADWERTPPQLRQRLDDLLGSYIRRNLSELGVVLTNTIKLDDFVSRFDRLVQAWVERGLRIEMIDLELRWLNGLGISGLPAFATIAAGASFIRHERSKVIVNFAGQTSPFEWRNPKGFSVFVWNRHLFLDEYAKWSLTVLEDDLRTSYTIDIPSSKILMYSSPFGYGHRANAVIIRVAPPVTRSFAARFTEAVKALKDIADAQSWSVVNETSWPVLWYMDGNLVFWLHWIAKAWPGLVYAHFGVQTFRDEMTKGETGLASRNLDRFPITCKFVIQVPGLSGYLVREMDGYSGRLLGIAVERMIASGQWHRLDRKALDSVWPRIHMLEGAVEWSWAAN